MGLAALIRCATVAAPGLKCALLAYGRIWSAGRAGMAARDQARRLSAGAEIVRHGPYLTRRGADWTKRFPAIVDAASKCASQLNRAYGFECESGPLENCVEWMELRRRLNLPPTFSPN